MPQHSSHTQALLDAKLQAFEYHLQHAASTLADVCSESQRSALMSGALSHFQMRLSEMQAELERITASAEPQRGEQDERCESVEIKMENVAEETQEAAMEEMREAVMEATQEVMMYDSEETEDELYALEMEDIQVKRECMEAREGDLASASLTTENEAAGRADTLMVHSPEKVQPVATTVPTANNRGTKAQDETSAVDTECVKPLELQLEMLKTTVAAATRGPISPDVLQSMAAMLESTMENLLQGEMAMPLVQPTLRLHESFLAIRHPDLKKILASAIQVLGGLINSFPETLGGLCHTHRSPVRDNVAQQCFATAIDLLTTTDARRRGELVDIVLHELKSGFKPAIVARQQLVKPSKRLQQPLVDPKFKCTVPWAGRVLLLTAHIVAYVVATHERLKTDRFMAVMQAISARHVLFPALLERSHKIVTKPPQLVIDGSEEAHPRRLHLKHEAHRIKQICALVCDQ